MSLVRKSLFRKSVQPKRLYILFSIIIHVFIFSTFVKLDYWIITVSFDVSGDAENRFIRNYSIRYSSVKMFVCIYYVLIYPTCVCLDLNFHIIVLQYRIRCYIEI